MIELKSANELEQVRTACQIAAEVLHRIGEAARPGVTTKELDEIAERLIYSFGCTPSFKGYSLGGALPPFPGCITTSVNEEIIHGIPSRRRLKDGELLKLDIGVFKDGFHGDTAITVHVGKPTKRGKRLADATKEALRLAISAVRPRARLGDVGHAIQSHVEPLGYSVVRDFVGHGLGRSLHEDPQVPHYGRAGHGLLIQEGMVFCIEPMINEGTFRVRMKPDRWTAVTADGKLSAQYEHAVAVTSEGAEILTLHEADRDFYLGASS